MPTAHAAGGVGSAASGSGSAAPGGKAKPAATTAHAANGTKTGAGKATASSAPSASAPQAGDAAKHDAAAAKHDDKKDDDKKDDDEAVPIPLGKGLPLLVNVAVFFLEVKSFDDTKGVFEATTDVRTRWYDLGLATRDAAGNPGRSSSYEELRGKKAEERLRKIWHPTLDAPNRIESAPYVGHRLRIFHDGRVELIERMTAKYQVKVDPQRFPFDRQQLTLELLSREDTTDEVVLRFESDDVTFSRVAREADVEGWDLGLVDLGRREIRGWNGDRYSMATASLYVDRVATTGLAPIFIPLVASLLIPLLALWMNKATEDGFEVDAFELANMGIGGLFSVIALSFAIYTSYGVIAGSDNTVTRLFGLNYATLAISLSIVVLLFRYNVMHRWFGRYVHEQTFLFLSWAMPLLTLGSSIAFLAAAAV
jgi:hypothetical protein